MKFKPAPPHWKSLAPGVLLGGLALCALLLSIIQRERAKSDEIAVLFRKIVQSVEREDFDAVVKIAQTIQQINFLLPYAKGHAYHANTVIREAKRVQHAATAPFLPYVVPRREQSSTR